MKYIVDVESNKTFDGDVLTPEEVIEILKEDIRLPVIVTISE